MTLYFQGTFRAVLKDKSLFKKQSSGAVIFPEISLLTQSELGVEKDTSNCTSVLFWYISTLFVYHCTQYL